MGGGSLSCEPDPGGSGAGWGAGLLHSSGTTTSVLRTGQWVSLHIWKSSKLFVWVKEAPGEGVQKHDVTLSQAQILLRDEERAGQAGPDGIPKNRCPGGKKKNRVGRRDT